MRQTSWHHLSGCQTAADPTISSHADGRLYAASVRTDGQVGFTSILRAPDGWAPWKIVNAGASPQLPAAVSTSPVLQQAGDRLYLFCRGVDDNVYVTSRRTGGSWAPWHRLTADSSVRGPISVTFTTDPWTTPPRAQGPGPHRPLPPVRLKLAAGLDVDRRRRGRDRIGRDRRGLPRTPQHQRPTGSVSPGPPLGCDLAPGRERARSRVRAAVPGPV